MFIGVHLKLQHVLTPSCMLLAWQGRITALSILHCSWRLVAGGLQLCCTGWWAAAAASCRCTSGSAGGRS